MNDALLPVIPLAVFVLALAIYIAIAYHLHRMSVYESHEKYRRVGFKKFIKWYHQRPWKYSYNNLLESEDDSIDLDTPCDIIDGQHYLLISSFFSFALFFVYTHAMGLKLWRQDIKADRKSREIP